MDPITMFLLQKKIRTMRDNAKRRAKAVGSWAVNNWKILLTLGVLTAYTILVAKLAYDKGQESADDKWIAKYDSTVQDFNARIEALKLSSGQVANNVDTASGNVGKDIEGIHKGVEKAAKDEKKSTAVSGTTTTCVKTAPALNDPVPKQLLKAWAEMNQAGAKHDPYADIVK